ncbi:MAG: molybdenum cofactor guanylyltransferase [Candidatus Alkanophagales archaeon]
MSRGRRAAVILAGGRGTRLRREKCLLELGGKPLIRWVADAVHRIVDELVVAVRNEAQADAVARVCDAKIAIDSFKGFGPLAGILAGLSATSAEYSVVLGCDMPLVRTEVVEFLFEVAEESKADAVVPKWDNGYMEPLHAVYKTDAMARATLRSILGGEKSIRAPLRSLNVKFVPVRRLREMDENLETLTNINSPADLKRLKL